MFQKALNLVLFGILTVGAATVGYGTFYGEGLGPSALGVLGLGEEKHEHGEHDDD